MIILNEGAKKALKITGAILGLLILWALYNLTTGTRQNAPAFNDYGSGEASLSSRSLSGMVSDSLNVSNKQQSAAMPEMMMETEDTGIYSDTSSDTTATDKKVIKNGNLSLKVESTEGAADEILQIAKNEGGEVFSTNFYERIKGQKSGTMTVRVPVDKFEDTMSKIKEVATQVVSESTNGQDVTEQYTDLQAQLKNKQAEEESFVKILDRAGEIDDVLKVTQQIARVRGEIERLQGKIKFMDSQTDMSTIIVSLSEDVEIAPVSNDWRPWQVTKKAFSDLIDNMQGFVDGLIRFIIVTLPSIIIFLVIVWIIWIAGKKVFKKIFKKGK